MGALTSFVEFFQKGGAWMYVIAALKVAAFIILVDRTIYLFFKRQKKALSIALSLEKPLKAGQFDWVESQIQQIAPKSAIGQVIQVAVDAARNLGGKDEIEGRIQEVLLQESGLLSRRIGFLPMLANAATLTGLLGTITGMIRAFLAVSFANPAEKAVLLSSGISEAMNTTAYGLIVAIPTLILYAILQNRADQIEEDLKQASLKVLNWLAYAYEPLGLKAGQRKSHPNPSTQVEC